MNPAKKSHAAIIIAYRDQASQGITAPRLVKPTYRSHALRQDHPQDHEKVMILFITIEQTAGASKDIRR
jgi:hypothetical protein